MRRLLAVILLAASPAFAQAKKLSDVACRLDGGAGCGGGAGSGTVTSVDISGGTTGFSFGGGPITTSGTFTLSGTLAVANGGTNATSASAARTSLGLAIGTDVQAYDADLGALAANSTNGLWGRTGAGTGSARTITGTTNETAITNGDGVSGNPVVGLAATIDLSSKTAVILKTGPLSSIPGTCTVGSVYVANDQTPGRNLYLCTSTDTWSLQGGQFPAVVSEASNATPSINCTVTDVYKLTAQAADITSVTITGTPAEEQLIRVSVTGTASRAITWGSSFESSLATLPTTTSGTARLDVLLVWNAATSKWRCLAVA